MGLRILESVLIVSLGLLLLEQCYVICDYGGKNQYPSMNNDAYGQGGGGGGGYGDPYGGDGYGEEERPKIKLNFGVHVPAMKIQLPRISLPKITIRAKVKQPNKPSTIHVPEINLETQSKVSPPGSKSASGDDGYGDSYGGSNNGGHGASNYGGQIMGGYSNSIAEYSHPAPSHYQSSKKQQAPSYGRGNNYEKSQESTYIAASNDYRDGTTSLSLSKEPDNGAYASSNKEYSVIGDYNKPRNDNYAQDATRHMGQYMKTNNANNNEQIFDNYNSASTNRNVIESRQNIIARDNLNVGDNKYRVASNSIMLNFPERFRSNQQTYLLDKSRSSSMIEPQPNNDMLSKPVHLVYSAIAQPAINEEEQRINHDYHSQHLNNVGHNNNIDNNVNNNANMLHTQQGHTNSNNNHLGQESRTFLQKISSPFKQVRNWLRPHNRE